MNTSLPAKSQKCCFPAAVTITMFSEAFVVCHCVSYSQETSQQRWVLCQVLINVTATRTVKGHCVVVIMKKLTSLLPVGPEDAQ